MLLIIGKKIAIKTVQKTRENITFMSICPLIEDTLCPYCGIELIGKIVTCNFRNLDNYLDGL